MTSEVSARRIVTLAASAFLVLAAEPLYVLVDTAVVGHLGRIPLAALGAAGTVMSLLGIVGSSLEYGTTGRAARYFGAGRRDAAVNEGVQASWLAVLIGVVVVVVGEVFASPIARLLAGGDGAVAHDAANWLRIAVVGMPGVLLVLAGNGWLRGVQDTRTPVGVVLAANGLSAVLSPILVYPAGLGLEGSAVANVVAQWLAAALFLVALRRQATGLAFQRAVAVRQLVVSRDLVIRTAAFQAAYLTATAVAGRMGTGQLAAHQIGIQLWELVALLLDSFAIAAQSLVGAALGGGDLSGARGTAWRVGRYGLYTGVVFAALLAAGWVVLPALFSADAGVQDQAHRLWPWLIAMTPIGGVVFALDGVLLGAGDNTFMAVITLVGALGGYVPLALLAYHFGWGIGGVWAGLASFVAIRLVGMSWRTAQGRWLVAGVTA